MSSAATKLIRTMKIPGSRRVRQSRKAVLMAIASLAENFSTEASYADIADYCGVSSRTAQNAVADLIKLGLLERISHSGRPSNFIINAEPAQKPAQKRPRNLRTPTRAKTDLSIKENARAGGINYTIRPQSVYGEGQLAHAPHDERNPPPAIPDSLEPANISSASNRHKKNHHHAERGLDHPKPSEKKQCNAPRNPNTIPSGGQRDDEAFHKLLVAVGQAGARASLSRTKPNDLRKWDERFGRNYRDIIRAWSEQHIDQGKDPVRSWFYIERVLETRSQKGKARTEEAKRRKRVKMLLAEYRGREKSLADTERLGITDQEIQARLSNDGGSFEGARMALIRERSCQHLV